MYYVNRKDKWITITKWGEGEKPFFSGGDEAWLLYQVGDHTFAQQLKEFQSDAELLLALANRVDLR